MYLWPIQRTCNDPQTLVSRAVAFHACTARTLIRRRPGKTRPKPHLLRQYLSEKDAAKKKELRAKLVALGAPALREAISEYGF